MNNNLARILEEETITSQWFWVSTEIKPGQKTYRVMAHIITSKLDEGERDYAVPLDSRTVDLVMTSEPNHDTVSQALSDAGYDLTKGTWRLMEWWLPETDGVADAF